MSWLSFTWQVVHGRPSASMARLSVSLKRGSAAPSTVSAIAVLPAASARLTMAWATSQSSVG